MRIFINLLPIILISLIAYVFVKNLIPEYQRTISLAQEINKLNNREKDLKELERIINELSKDKNIAKLIERKETLEVWLPREPQITEIIAYFVNTYRTLGIGEFPGTNFNISKEEKYFVSPFVLPISFITFSLSFDNLDMNKIQEFISYIDKSSRIMKIKKADFSIDEKGNIKSNFIVETYYLILTPTKK
jgi:hypothetical protein